MDRRKTVISIDDLCDQWWPIGDLVTLKQRYPNFKATLFTIPFKTTPEFLYGIAELGWIEIAVHGLSHDNLDEMLVLSKQQVIEGFSKIDFSLYARGFKAPGWRLNEQTIECCNEFGMWVALQGKQESWKSLCRHGHYPTTNKNRFDYWLGHTHDVEDNYITKTLPMLLKKWPVGQEFAFVSEAIER